MIGPVRSLDDARALAQRHYLEDAWHYAVIKTHDRLRRRRVIGALRRLIVSRWLARLA